MYCPKCGDPMKVKGGTFECIRGNMSLSERLRDELYASFIVKSKEPKEPVYRGKIGGMWFCPGCGVAMRVEGPGVVRCPSCLRNIAGSMWDLIELHPHD